MMSMAKQGGKGGKIGRNKIKCAAYAAAGTREKNGPQAAAPGVQVRKPRKGNQTPHSHRSGSSRPLFITGIM